MSPDTTRSNRSKAVIVTTEVPIQTGGIGTFNWNLAKLLRLHGHDVLVILANPITVPRKVWTKPFDEVGIDTDYVFGDKFTVPDGYSWHKRVSEVVSGMIPDDTDVVYLADWQAKGSDFVRRMRFALKPGPTTVTILHGSTRWLREAMRIFPDSEEHLYLDSAEAYCAQHSDYVVSPGMYMLSWAQGAGWKLPDGSRSRVINCPFFPLAEQSFSQASVNQQMETRLLSPAHAPTSSRREASIAPTLRSTVELESVEDALGSMHMHAFASRSIPTTVMETPDRNEASDVPLGHSDMAAQPKIDGFRRIVFFGRIETRKGIELFVNGLERLKGKPCLRTIEEIVLLGGPSANPLGAPAEVAAELQRRLDGTIKVQALSKLNTFQAQQYLAERAADTLVVVPSLRENFPLSVIETSLIPGLNILASNAGSIGEILGPKGRDHLFEPFLAPFTKKLEEMLTSGPKADSDLGHYNWQQANDAWIAFHEEAVSLARARRLATGGCLDVSATDSVPATMPVTDRSVDVCVSYYNLGDYLPYMLKSLERQTVQDFNVIVVNDGSTDTKSIQVFEEQAAKYQDRGWQFVTTPNGGLSAARNAGAVTGSGRYLIFIDADDVVAPTLVERFRDAIERSGDDCLSCYMHLFRGAGWNDAYAHSSFYFYTPSGPDPVLGLVSNPFGGACCIVTREAFDAIAGFTTDVSRYVGFEDYEFYLRLMLDGFRLDVVPEYLLYYRIRDEGMFRTNDLYENKARILRTYESKLQEMGFPGLATFAAGLYQQLSAGQGGGTVTKVDVPYLVYHVSGHLIWKALRFKVRNQIAKLFGRPPISE